MGLTITLVTVLSMRPFGHMHASIFELMMHQIAYIILYMFILQVEYPICPKSNQQSRKKVTRFNEVVTKNAFYTDILLTWLIVDIYQLRCYRILTPLRVG